MTPTKTIEFTEREIKALRVALIFGIPDDGGDKTLKSAMRKLRSA